MAIQDIIKRVPVYVELDRPEEKAFAIQQLYKQVLNIMDTVKAGGGGGSQPGPNTVGSEQIIDGSIEKVDLNDEVKAGLEELKDANNYAIDSDVDSIFASNQ